MLHTLLSRQVHIGDSFINHPKLQVRFSHTTLSLQDDEFDMAWHSTWSAYFEDGDEFDDFIGYFFENACRPPLQLAMEEIPLGLLVCTNKCKEGYTPVFQELEHGQRVRKCKRVPVRTRFTGA